MILETILNLLQKVFFALFNWLNVPAMPAEVIAAITGFFDLLEYGTGFIGFFLPAKIVVPFFVVFFAIFAVDHGYPFIMWIIRKIPVSIN